MAKEQSEPNEWGFQELSESDNQIIHEARGLGFASFWPALPSATAQAQNTLAGAKRFLDQREKQIAEMRDQK